MTETANVDFASDVAAIRTGTNAVTVVAKSNIADKSRPEVQGNCYCNRN